MRAHQYEPSPLKGEYQYEPSSLRGEGRVGVNSMTLRDCITPIPAFPRQGGRGFLGALLFVAIVAIVDGSLACTPQLPGATIKPLESKNYALAFRTQPHKIEIGKHFALELALCQKEGAVAPESVRVDAHMPEHRHGMNYRTTVTATGQGRYRAEGLMFHMPGRWEYIFELRTAGASERLTTSVILQ